MSKYDNSSVRNKHLGQLNKLVSKKALTLGFLTLSLVFVGAKLLSGLGGVNSVSSNAASDLSPTTSINLDSIDTQLPQNIITQSDPSNLDKGTNKTSTEANNSVNNSKSDNGTKVRVNGQDIVLSPDNSVHTVVPNSDKTTVDVVIQNNTSPNFSSHTTSDDGTTNVQIYSSSRNTVIDVNGSTNTARHHTRL